MNPTQVIEKKRDGLELSQEEIEFFIRQYIAEQIPDYQMAAWLMAIYLRGMSFEETLWLTRAMLESGEKIDLSAIAGIKVDKHSTGGVGDKVSLVLAPLVAAAGVPVPMISGRGLGHGGGTLDKLEAIPGFQTHLAPEEFKRQVQEIGLAIIGQTDTIVPADKKIYALRNSTATVNSIPLITASIMSKKLAEGIDALVLDVKVGQGSFFREKVEALKLARSLIAAGEKFGLKTVALLTAMNQPLGKAVGNWLETREAIQTLKGKGPSDLLEVVLALGAEMLVLAGKAITVEDGIQKLQVLLKAGTAYKKFLQLVERQHGSKHLIEHPETYPEPQYSASIKSPRKGFLCRINARTIGLASMALGAGRVKMTDDIDYGAGMVLEKKVGDEVDANEMIAQVFSNRKMAIENSLALIETAFEISEEKPEPEALILGRMDATDLI